MPVTSSTSSASAWRAHRLLTDPNHSQRSISGVAYDVGFSDLSYFNRTFRRRFGMTPGEARRRGRE